MQPSQPSHSAIQLRAYELWQIRVENDGPGDALGDWLAAELELRALLLHDQHELALPH